MKTQTRILDNRLYYTRKIELHRKGKKSRTVRITPILICPLAAKSLVLITVRRVHYGKMSKAPTTLIKAEEPSLPYYLPIAGWRIIGFIPFPRVLVLCEMQSVSSRIWTRVAMSISYDNNHNTTGTFKHNYANKNLTTMWHFCRVIIAYKILIIMILPLSHNSHYIYMQISSTKCNNYYGTRELQNWKQYGNFCCLKIKHFWPI